VYILSHLKMSHIYPVSLIKIAGSATTYLAYSKNYISPVRLARKNGLCWYWFIVREKHYYFAEKFWPISLSEQGLQFEIKGARVVHSSSGPLEIVVILSGHSVWWKLREFPCFDSLTCKLNAINQLVCDGWIICSRPPAWLYVCLCHLNVLLHGAMLWDWSSTILGWLLVKLF
jgi:hypothetical protein